MLLKEGRALTLTMVGNGLIITRKERGDAPNLKPGRHSNNEIATTKEEALANIKDWMEGN